MFVNLSDNEVRGFFTKTGTCWACARWVIKGDHWVAGTIRAVEWLASYRAEIVAVDVATALAGVHQQIPLPAARRRGGLRCAEPGCRRLACACSHLCFDHQWFRTGDALGDPVPRPGRPRTPYGYPSLTVSLPLTARAPLRAPWQVWE
jgi:hypothetical protein